MHAASTAPTPDLDVVFRSLADPTRRGVIERLGRGPASVSELAAPFEMALPSLMQHLRVLEGGGLVASSKRGRVRTYRLCPEAFAPADAWLARQRDVWDQRLDQLDELLLRLHAEREEAEKP